MLGGKQLCRKVPAVLQGLNFLYGRSVFISGSYLLWKIDGKISVSGLYKCFLIRQDSRNTGKKGVGVSVRATSSWDTRETRAVNWMKGFEGKTAEKATTELRALSF